MKKKNTPAPLGSGSTFESIKHINEYGMEYWTARELLKVLEYNEYRFFKAVIMRAIESCKAAKIEPSDHFVETHDMIETAKTARRRVPDFHLSRYACYLIVQNADPSKPSVALGQAYFAIQTRKQELNEQDQEDYKRLYLRSEMKQHNVNLSEAARDAGVVSSLDFAIFHNHGYQGLYGGLGAKQIAAKKGIRKSSELLDHMGSTELAANLFRATQTEEKLRRENIRGKENANQVHYAVGRKVRQTIRELGGTMPEDLPSEEHIKHLEKRHPQIAATAPAIDEKKPE